MFEDIKIRKYKNFISFYTLENIQTFSFILFDKLIKKNNVTDRLIRKKTKKKKTNDQKFEDIKM